MVREVTATEAKAKLLALLDDVENGEPVDITRHGRLVARIVPARSGMALWGLHEGKVTIHATDEELFTAVDPSEWDPASNDW
jgi:prevent-host-death family protein